MHAVQSSLFFCFFIDYNTQSMRYTIFCFTVHIDTHICAHKQMKNRCFVLEECLSRKWCEFCFSCFTGEDHLSSQCDTCSGHRRWACAPLPSTSHLHTFTARLMQNVFAGRCSKMTHVFIQRSSLPLELIPQNYIRRTPSRLPCLLW